MRRQFVKGQVLRADDINAIVEEVVRVAKISVTPPLQLTEGPYGNCITLAQYPFWAVLCGRDGNAYSFQEVDPTEGGNWRVKEGGKRSGKDEDDEDIFNSYEWNHISTPIGAVVRMEPVLDGEFRFQWPGPVLQVVSCDGSSSSSSSSSSGDPGEETECTTTNEVEFVYTRCVEGEECDITTKITFPFDVNVCVTEPEGGC